MTSSRGSGSSRRCGQRARPGWFVAGRRLELSRALTERVLADGAPIHRRSLVDWLRARNDVSPLSSLTVRDRRVVGRRRPGVRAARARLRLPARRRGATTSSAPTATTRASSGGARRTWISRCGSAGSGSAVATPARGRPSFISGTPRATSDGRSNWGLLEETAANGRRRGRARAVRARARRRRFGRVAGSLSPRRVLAAVCALTALGAALRFATLDAQSFWLDELVTVSLLDRGFGDELARGPGARGDAVPLLRPRVALVARLRARRGRPPVALGARRHGDDPGRVRRGRRARLAPRRASSPRRSSPRSRSWPGTRRRPARTRSSPSSAPLGARVRAVPCAAAAGGTSPAGRSLASLAIATHYFAVFLVAAEALWLLLRLRRAGASSSRRLVPALALVAHVPLLLEQRGNGEAVAGTLARGAHRRDPKNLVVGYSFPAEVAGSVVAAALLLVGLALLVRVVRRARRGALVAGSSPPPRRPPGRARARRAPTT